MDDTLEHDDRRLLNVAGWLVFEDPVSDLQVDELSETARKKFER